MVLVLALGIGINSALFTVLSAVTTRPPPGIPRDDALVWIRTIQRPRREYPNLSKRGASYLEYRDYVAHTELFSAVAAYAVGNVVLDQGANAGGPTAISTEFVTSRYFSTLGVRLAVGPGLSTVDDADAAPPDLRAVISDALWRDRFGGSMDVVGKTLHLNGVAVTVVGVAPPRFLGAWDREANTVWVPLSARAALLKSGFGMFSSRDSLEVSVFARLRPGVSPQRATPTVAMLAQRSVAAMSPKARPFVGTADVVPLRTDNQDPEGQGQWRSIGLLLGSITFLVLIITCLNVSALLVGSAFGRRAEIAIRLALGAPRRRIVRQLLTESALVAVTGGALGLLLLWWFFMAASASTDDVDLSIGWDTVAFTLIFATGTGLLFGISPALHATRATLADVMKRSAAAVVGSRSRLQRGFVIGQVALTQPLLLGLGIMLGDAIHQMGGRAEAGMRDRLVSVQVAWMSGRDIETMRANAARILERFRAVPGVAGAVFAGGGYGLTNFTVHPHDRGVGATADPFDVRLQGAPPGYFKLMDIPIMRGRDFTEDDQRTQSAVVIGSDLARKLWGTTSPIGMRFQTLRSDGPYMDGNTSTTSDVVGYASTEPPKLRDLVIVGVVDAAKAGKSDDVDGVRVLEPGVVQQSGILIRTSGPGDAMIPILRSIANAEFGQVPLERIQTLAQQDAAARRDLLQGCAMAAGAGMLVLILASIGLYGVVSFAVGQRTREIGIRIAPGATPRAVVAMFFRGGVVLGAIGLVVGLPLSIVAMRILADRVGLPHVNTAAMTAGIAVIVIAVSSLATWLPARRASRVNPLLALRAE